MSTLNLKAFGPPVLSVTLTVTATEPLTVAFANGLTIFTLSLSGCTVIVCVGGVGSLTPALSTTVSDAAKVPADKKKIAPGLSTERVGSCRKLQTKHSLLHIKRVRNRARLNQDHRLDVGESGAGTVRGLYLESACAVTNATEPPGSAQAVEWEGVIIRIG